MWRTSSCVVRSSRSRASAARRLSSDRRGGGGASGAFERFRQATRKNKKPREPSFSEKFLDPAARGELKKHQSGIPKLAARKNKSKTPHDQFPGKEAEEVLPHEQPLDIFEQALDEPYRVAAAAAATGQDDYFGKGSLNQRRVDQNKRDTSVLTRETIEASLPKGVEYVTEDDGDDDHGYEVVKMDTSFLTRTPQSEYKEYLERNYFDPVNKYADPEEEYEPWDEKDFIDVNNHPDITIDEDGTYVLQYNPETEGDEIEGDDDEDYEYSDTGDEDNRPMVKQRPRNTNARNDDVDLEERFFYPDVLDFDDPYYGPVPDEIVNQIRPLQERGPNLEDFLEATYQHPTKFAEVRRYNLHFESRREPKPIIPKHRRNPPYEWVEVLQKVSIRLWPSFSYSRGGS